MQLQNFRTDRLQHAATDQSLRWPGIGKLALLVLALIAGPAQANIPRFDATAHGQAVSVATTDYGYDNDDRLIQTTVRHQPEDASRPDQRSDWTLDAVGNRLTETVTRLADNTETASKTYAYNNRDQLTLMQDSVNQIAVSYAYDGNGNRVSRTVTKPGQVDQISTTFDARDRLIKAEPNAPNINNAPTVEYVYDAEGRRVERIETPATGSPIRATIYLYDGATLAHEAAPDAAANTPNRTGLRLTDSYRHSAKLAYHLEIDAAGNSTITFYQLDALDTPVALSDSAGNTQSRTTFDAWGVIDQQVANGIVQTPWQLPNYNPAATGQAALLTSDGQSIGFTGYQKDPTTGLYYAGARWYDPLLGSFNGMDPANGNPESPVTFNKYLYANGNPLIYVDRDGRCAEPISFTICVAALAGIIGYEASVIHDEITNHSSFGEAATNLRNVGNGVAVSGIVLSGGTLGVPATAALVAGGATVDVAKQVAVDGRSFGEIDQGEAFRSGGLTAGGGAVLGFGLASASPVIAGGTKATALTLAALGAKQGGQDIGEGIANGNTAQVLFGVGEVGLGGAGVLGLASPATNPGLLSKSQNAFVRAGSSPADAMVASEMGGGGVGVRLGIERPLAKLVDAEKRIALRQRVMANIAENRSATQGTTFDMQVGFETAMFGDVSSEGRGIVLSSRTDRFGNENSDLAKRFAGQNNLVIINDTAAGRKLSQLMLFERFAKKAKNPAISAQTLRMWDILSDRFVRQSPQELPVFGFVDNTDATTVFSRVELKTIEETNRQIIRVRVKGPVPSASK